ncbi:MAG TPA: PhzF family phenazine biosynthesis protein [Spirochaetia bacterium]|nr:PhzF family phenazine biosynthesis protein [Spirochaetia bacterium]
MKREFYIVDVFAEEKYAGNQLAVFLDGHLYSDSEMQKLAGEMHFSETVFIFPRESSGHIFKARIFTPADEIPFAGHPTLGTAYVIAREILKDRVEEVVLDLPAGRIPVSLTYDPAGEIENLTMRQLEPRFGPLLNADMAAAALNVPPAEIDPRFPVQEVSTGMPFLIVPLQTLAGIRSARVNLEELNRLFDRFESRAVLVFCPETYDQKNTLHVRVFAPCLGVPEDPATGSAGGCLAGYLLKYGYLGAGQIDITVEQGYEVGRKSLLRLSGNVAEGKISVFVGGRVFTVAKGCLL